jgi:hypothetical protein
MVKVGLVKVKSSNLAAIGYDRATKTLRILFAEGSAYDYRAVPASVYKSLMAAESKGSFFQQHVVGRYQFEKVNLREEGQYDGKEQSAEASRSARRQGSADHQHSTNR